MNSILNMSLVATILSWMQIATTCYSYISLTKMFRCFHATEACANVVTRDGPAPAKSERPFKESNTANN